MHEQPQRLTETGALMLPTSRKQCERRRMSLQSLLRVSGCWLCCAIERGETLRAPEVLAAVGY